MDIQDIRAALPVLSHCVYLNTGTAGPLPQNTLQVLQQEVGTEGQYGRINPAGSLSLKSALLGCANVWLFFCMRMKMKSP